VTEPVAQSMLELCLTAEEKMEKLGILINSTAHTESVIQLVGAAKERGKTAEIFLAAHGVRILENMVFRNLAGICRVWVCSASIEALGADSTLPVPETCRLVPPENLAEFIRSCDRHVVF
jgi:predicted peroxiredoxin